MKKSLLIALPVVCLFLLTLFVLLQPTAPAKEEGEDDFLASRATYVGDSTEQDGYKGEPEEFPEVEAPPVKEEEPEGDYEIPR